MHKHPWDWMETTLAKWELVFSVKHERKTCQKTSQSTEIVIDVEQARNAWRLHWRSLPGRHGRPSHTAATALSVLQAALTSSQQTSTSQSTNWHWKQSRRAMHVKGCRRHKDGPCLQRAYHLIKYYPGAQNIVKKAFHVKSHRGTRFRGPDRLCGPDQLCHNPWHSHHDTKVIQVVMPTDTGDHIPYRH